MLGQEPDLCLVLPDNVAHDQIIGAIVPARVRLPGHRPGLLDDDLVGVKQARDLHGHFFPTLRRTWESIKEVMAPGALDPLTKELIYLAVSASNGCAYCIASHGAAAKKQGMTPAMLGELMAVVGMANETNSLANGYRVPVDERFEKLF